MAKFNAAGSVLEYVAFLGNTSGPAAVKAAASGDVYIAGAGRIPGSNSGPACTDGYAATLMNSGSDLVNARCLLSVVAETTILQSSAKSEPNKIQIGTDGTVYRPELFNKDFEFCEIDGDGPSNRKCYPENHETASIAIINLSNITISRRHIGSSTIFSFGATHRSLQSFSVTPDGAMVTLYCGEQDSDSSARLYSRSGGLEARYEVLSPCLSEPIFTAVGADGKRYFAAADSDGPKIFDESGRPVGGNVRAEQPDLNLQSFSIDSSGSLIVVERRSTGNGSRIRKLDPDRSKAGLVHPFLVHDEIFSDAEASVLPFGTDSLLLIETTSSTEQRNGLQAQVVGGTDAGISRYELSSCFENNGLLSLDQTNTSITEGSGIALIGVTRSMVANDKCSATVRYQAAADSAASGNDFVSTAGTLRWAPGENGTKFIQIPIVDDSQYELTESLSLTLNEPVGSTLATNSSMIVRITDDDSMPSVGLTISTSSIPELGGTATLTARLSAIAGTPVTVPLLFSGTATFGSDYQAPTQIVIPAGSRFVDVQVSSIDNTQPEPNETAIIAIGQPTSATLGSRTTASFTILDNDRAPAVTTTPTSLAFGNQAVGSTSAAQTLTLTNSGTDPLTISFIGASGDFIASPSCPMVLAVSTSCSIAVQFRPSLAGPRAGALTILSNAPTSPNSVQLTGTGTQGRPTLSISDTSIAEGNTGTKSASLTVSLSAAAREPVSVKVRTRNGTAIAGSDYVAAAATLTIPAGRTSLAVSVTVNGDSTFEPDEVFYVDLTEPAAAVIGDGEGSVTILNDDTAPGTPGISVPTRNFNFGNVRVGSSSAQRTLTITSSGTAPLMIRSVRVTGDFVGTSNCLASLAPGATCALTGTFRPATTGLRTGTITITSNAPDSPTVVQLSGTGS